MAKRGGHGLWKMASDIGRGEARPSRKVVVLDGLEQGGWYRREEAGMDEME